jgi:hypothetical protein
MAGKGPWTFTSESSPSLTVTMGPLGPVHFRDGVAQVESEEQAEELRDWAEKNPGYKVSEGAPKPKKADKEEKDDG